MTATQYRPTPNTLTALAAITAVRTRAATKKIQAPHPALFALALTITPVTELGSRFLIRQDYPLLHPDSERRLTMLSLARVATATGSVLAWHATHQAVVGERTSLTRKRALTYAGLMAARTLAAQQITRRIDTHKELALRARVPYTPPTA